ncbi:hypothetical protein [Pontiella agarivorans]|uniref:Uncharacterized protein n=1 Tax=Pontiella agarivorans TaxID=3038953 RepID=A0ABU5MXX0_9BACT|nr:hypothetical protein [Pontiella agarivorans]MDZ8119065.1 hypothetical protein [Pontiella agarivorans]
MKKIFIISMFAGLVLQGYAVSLIDYQHNDPSNTPLKNLQNDGIDTSGWNLNRDHIVANGAGDLSCTITNASQTKFIFASALTNGYVEFEYRISSYDLTGIPNKDGIGIDLFTSSGVSAEAIKLKLETFNDTVRLRAPFPKADGSGVAYPNRTLGAKASTIGVTYKVTIDLDASTNQVAVFSKLDTDTDFIKMGGAALFGACTNLTELRLQPTYTGEWPSNNFVNIDYITLTSTVEPPAYAGESWQFNEAADTPLSGLVNDLGEASFADISTVLTDGNGALRFEQDPVLGTSGYGKEATVPSQTEGVVEMNFKLLALDFSGGDDAGANVSFSLRDSSVNKDVMNVRVFKQTGKAQIQSRFQNDEGGSNIPLYRFGTNVVDEAIDVRVLANLDTDTFDVFYTLDGESEVNVTNNMPMNYPDMTFDRIRIWSTVNTNDFGPSDFVTIDYLRVVPVSSMIPETYETWLELFPTLGAATNKTDNPDGDALNNLYEYALNGNPTDAADIGYIPTSQLVEDGGSWLQYVYAKRADADTRGLNYYLETDTDLMIAPGWTNAFYDVIGTNTEFAVGFNAITNRISTDTKSQQFIQLQIEQL